MKKCLKPNRFYKISNKGLIEVIDQMVKFRKRDSIRIRPYYILILALVTYVKPMIPPIIYEGTRKLLQKLASHRRNQIDMKCLFQLHQAKNYIMNKK